MMASCSRSEMVLLRVQTGRAASVGLHPHIGARGRIVTDQNGGKAGLAAYRVLDLRRPGRGVREDLTSDSRAVE